MLRPCRPSTPISGAGLSNRLSLSFGAAPDLEAVPSPEPGSNFRAAVLDSVAMEPRKKLVAYLGATFVVSWLIASVYSLAGGEFGSPSSQAVVILYALPPGLLAVALHGALERNRASLKTLGLEFRISPWWLFAWLCPLVIFILAEALGLLLPGTSPAWSVEDFLARFPSDDPRYPEFSEDVHAFVRDTGLPPVARLILPTLLAGTTFHALRGLGEEVGWRGFLHHGLHRELGWSLDREALVVGLLWGAFWAPLTALGMWYEEASWANIPMGLAFSLAMSALLLRVRLLSGGVFAPAVLYGTMEAVARLPSLSNGFGPRWVGVHGMTGVLALLLVFGGLEWMIRRGRR